MTLPCPHCKSTVPVLDLFGAPATYGGTVILCPACGKALHLRFNPDAGEDERGRYLLMPEEAL